MKTFKFVLACLLAGAALSGCSLQEMCKDSIKDAIKEKGLFVSEDDVGFSCRLLNEEKRAEAERQAGAELLLDFIGLLPAKD